MTAFRVFRYLSHDWYVNKSVKNHEDGRRKEETGDAVIVTMFIIIIIIIITWGGWRENFIDKIYVVIEYVIEGFRRGRNVV